MSFKSQAQRKKFQAMVAEGKMDQATLDEWQGRTKGPLPERVEKPLGRKMKGPVARAIKAKRASKA